MLQSRPCEHGSHNEPDMPELPKSLKHLHCNNTLLKVLPKLPKTLELLCYDNVRIGILPDIPKGTYII